MKLGIYSLKKIVFQGEVASLTCTTVAGEITVLPHHRPLLTILGEGIIKIIDRNQKEQFFSIKSGFLEVTSDNEAKCIVD